MNYRVSVLAGAAALLTALLPQATFAYDYKRADLHAFIQKMSASHGFEKAWLQELFAEAERKQKILDAISRPAEKSKTWPEYRALFVNERRIEGGVKFWRTHRDTLEQVSQRCGVPAHLIVAILGVETNYGRLTGGYRVIDALTTLAFDYPPRSAFFRDELEQFLLLTREESLDPLAATGSYAGAMGAPQFISSSYRRYSVDASGDGQRDLWNDWTDVIGSVANYFTAFGWRAGEPVVSPARMDGAARKRFESATGLAHSVASLRKEGVSFATLPPEDAMAMIVRLEGPQTDEVWVGFKNFYVITRYNRSHMYALAAHQLGEEIHSRVRDETG